MNLDKEVFTTFEAAKICNANITSIKNWIEQGELSAFRTPGGHYRIQRHVIIDFLNRHGMPNPFLERDRRRLLVGLPDPALSESLAERLDSDTCEVQIAQDSIDALLRIGHGAPDLVLLGEEFGIDILQLIERLDTYTPLTRVQLAVVTEDLSEALEESARVAVLPPAFGDPQHIERLERHMLTLLGAPKEEP